MIIDSEPDEVSMASLVTMTSAIEVLDYWSIGVLEKLWKPPPGGPSLWDSDSLLILDISLCTNAGG